MPWSELKRDCGKPGSGGPSPVGKGVSFGAACTDGRVFTLECGSTLRYHPPRGETGDEPARRSAMNFSGTRPLFVVEDDSEIVVTIDRLLKRAWPLQVASSFREGLAVIESGLPLAGAILDVRLPDGSGINLLSLLRDHHPTIRI